VVAVSLNKKMCHSPLGGVGPVAEMGASDAVRFPGPQS